MFSLIHDLSIFISLYLVLISNVSSDLYWLFYFSLDRVVSLSDWKPISLRYLILSVFVIPHIFTPSFSLIIADSFGEDYIRLLGMLCDVSRSQSGRSPLLMETISDCWAMMSVFSLFDLDSQISISMNMFNLCFVISMNIFHLYFAKQRFCFQYWLQFLSRFHQFWSWLL